MQYVGKVFSTVSQLYKELNPATLSGAIDVVVVEGRDGEFSCSPFHVRFGKLQLLRPSDKAVQVIVNDSVADFYMKVGDAGEGFFVLETDADVPSQFATSPVASPSLSFRSDQADPDFLDLGGNVKEGNDGYVSAPSAHETDSEGDDDDDDEAANSLPSTSPLPSPSPSPSHPPALPKAETARSTLSLAFTDDMALDIRQREPILHQLDSLSNLPRPRASTLTHNSVSLGDEDGGLLQLKSSGFRRHRHRRPLSVVSDLAYVLDNFSSVRDDRENSDVDAAAASVAVGGGGNSNDSNGIIGDDTTGPDGLHSSWDWGVKLAPNQSAVLLSSFAGDQDRDMDRDHRTPSPLLPAVSAAPAVDIPQLLRQATAEADQPSRPVLEISLCGADSLRDPALSALSFDAARVHQTEFQADPIGVLTNPGLVFRDSAGAYVQGEALVLSLVSQLAFGQPLPGGMKAPLPAAATLAGVVPESNRADLITAEQQEPPQQEPPLQQQQADSVAAKPEGRRWWRWGQRSVATQATTQVTAVSATATPRSSPLVNNEDDHDPADTTADADIAAMDRLSLSSGAPLASGYLSDDGKLVHPMVARRHVRYAKTLRLTSAQLKSLNLRRGANDIKFLVPSNKAYCEARIYLYRYDTQIVISDIDGTITKSDALGHLFNMVGKDWTHPGVAKLYTDIANNGYEILYLTSRAIGQADGTRYFITNVKQAGYKLPLGPLLLSPDRLFTSFHREVIMKRPHEFKMACLRDIKNLFGEQSPFYAGFGNRITDAMSYRSVNVPVSRICTIDTTGEIKLDLLPGYKSSYVKMNDLVDMMFPALSSKLDPKFNDWEYWRPGLPSIDDELAEIEEQLAREAVAANVLAADATTAIVSNNATVANATPAASNNTSIVSRRLPPNALAVVYNSAPPPPRPQSASLFTRAARAMSNAGTPSAPSPLPPHPSSPGLLASSSPPPSSSSSSPAAGLLSRPRADSWSSQTISHPAVDDLDKVFPALSTSPPPPVELAYSANDMADSEEEDANIIDDEDEDEEDYIDQDMLDMMHDMEEVQRLQ